MKSATLERETQRQQQVRDAEELLFTGPQKLGFAKGLFLGRFVHHWVMPYPCIPPDQEDDVNSAVAEVRRFMEERHDPKVIDLQADIPRDVIEGLGRLGVLGMTAPIEVGGRGFSGTPRHHGGLPGDVEPGLWGQEVSRDGASDEGRRSRLEAGRRPGGRRAGQSQARGRVGPRHTAAAWEEPGRASWPPGWPRRWPYSRRPVQGLCAPAARLSAEIQTR